MTTALHKIIVIADCLDPRRMEMVDADYLSIEANIHLR
jgi:hypothetical protein